MEKVWLKNQNIFDAIVPEFEIENKLPIGIYNVLHTKQGFKLSKVNDKFEFNYKIYDIEQSFIDVVCKTYENINNNLGILLNGTQGTGKTITAKLIANKLNLPVILLKDFEDANDEFLEFVNEIHQDCIIFADEFEKMFCSSDSFPLKLMDSVYNNIYKRVFLLTTNNLTINGKLFERPSRIRYIKTFKTLSDAFIDEYLKDNLINLENIEKIKNFLKKLNLITIDILKTITEEVNIHNDNIDFILNEKILNITFKKYQYGARYFKIYNKTVLSEYESLTDIKLLEKIKASVDDCRIAIKDKHSSCFFTRIVLEKELNELIPGDYIQNLKILTFSKTFDIVVASDGVYSYYYVIENKFLNDDEEIATEDDY